MSKFTSSFKNKRFKYGSFSAITAAIVIAALIVINLIFSQFELKFDITENKMYTISDTSKEIAAGLEDEVNIYALYKTGSENTAFTEILEQYKAASSKINVIYKDPYLYPNFTNKYDTDGYGIGLGSIIVEKGDKFKVIDADELVSYDYNYDTYEASVISIDIEPEVTNAIRFVTMDSLPAVYYVTGHGEENIPSNVKSQLESANYEVRTLDLFSQEKIPDDCAVLFMTVPKIDYSERESDIVKDYLANDGRAAVISYASNNPITNFESVVSAYGMVTAPNIIVEGDPSHMAQGVSLNVLAGIEKTEATAEALDRNLRVLVSPALPLKQAETKNTITIEPILTTSDKAYSKRMDPTSFNFEEGDEMGPFNLGVAITDSYYTDDNHTTKLVVLSSVSFLYDEADSLVSGGNSGFITSCVNWLNDSEDNVYIAPKSLESETIIVDFASGIVIIFICCVVIPVGFLITGIVVWLKRRNK